jgi:hypothetical protein
LAAVKCVDELDTKTSQSAFPGILLKSAARMMDEFIEVHIWGPISRTSFEHITIRRPGKSEKVLASEIRRIIRDAKLSASVEILN